MSRVQSPRDTAQPAFPIQTVPPDPYVRVQPARLTKIERHARKHYRREVNEVRRQHDEAQAEAHNRIRTKYAHLGPETVAALIADSDRDFNMSRSRLERGMAAASSHAEASGFIPQHAVRSVRAKGTEKGRAKVAEQKARRKDRMSPIEKIVREARKRYSHLRATGPGSEAASILPDVNRMRRAKKLPETNEGALRKYLERLDFEDQKAGHV